MSLQSAPTTTYAGGVTSSGIVSAAQSSIEGGSSRGARAPPAGAVPAGPAGGKRTSSKDDGKLAKARSPHIRLLYLL